MKKDLKTILKELEKTIELKHELMERINDHITNLRLDLEDSFTKDCQAINDSFYDITVKIEKNINFLDALGVKNL